MSTVLWTMRGRAWPVECAYPKTKRNHPCYIWVPGEWSRCRYHNRRAYYRYGHDVNPDVRRWQTFDGNGKMVDRPEPGVGVLRLRPSGSTPLYERGYVRPPKEVLRLLPKFAHRTYDRLRQMRLWRRDVDNPETVAADVARTDIATGLSEVVRATRFATASFGAGLILTRVAILVSGDFRTGTQYLATLGFFLVWAAISAGAYQRSVTWLRGACVKTLPWWAVIFVPVGVLNLVFTVAGRQGTT